MTSDDLQSQWLGRMQQEIGVLHTNLMLAHLERDALTAKIAADACLIEALKARCTAAEEANTDLKAELQPKTHARKRRGPHAIQSH